jgi:hypothetical protein
MRFLHALPLALCTLAVGCEGSTAPTPVAAETAAAAPPKATAAPSATATAAAVTSATAAAASATAGATPPNKDKIAVDESKIDKSIPDIPSERSAPPTMEEWKTGTVVNSQQKNSRPDRCELKIVRESSSA